MERKGNAVTRLIFADLLLLKKAIVWLIWQLGSINIGPDQNLVPVFRLLNCAI